MLKRVAITGPESTGKSTLAQALANHFHTAWVSEFAREYLKEKGTHYSIDDVLEIAKGQLKSEETQALLTDTFLFCDTDMLVTKIWCDVVFNTCPPWIEQQFKNHRYDLYLLCYPDIAWEPDPLRENPENRETLFGYYEEALKANGMPYEIISGKGTQRIAKAISFVKKLKA